MKIYGLVYPKGNGEIAEVVIFDDDRVPKLNDFPEWVAKVERCSEEHLKRELIDNNIPRIVRCSPCHIEYPTQKYYNKENYNKENYNKEKYYNGAKNE
jgi:hypothetical protein